MSLHTQYRPTKWAEVIGQDEVVSSLKWVVAERRAKAFIFCGPSGVGKTTIARILANKLVGKEGTSANIYELAAADHTGVDSMRMVADQAMYRALGGSPVKAIILDECHRLSGQAWDVLLKPIEEPPEHVYWMLCTTNLGKVPKTIQTRCLRYDLKPVEDLLIYDLLTNTNEGGVTPTEILEEIAWAAEGSPRQALVYLEACLGCKTLDEAKAVMRTPGQSKEGIDLAKYLLSGTPRTWGEAIKYVKPLEGMEAESIRIMVVNYLSAVLLKTVDNSRAARILGLVEAFSDPYNQSDKFAPLLMSIGFALGLDK